MNNEISSLFDIFNNNKIRYFILRDYSSINRIHDSADIDMYVDKRDKKKIQKILKKNKWYSTILNDNKYPHKQYTRIINNKIVKLDLVFDFRYGKKNYYINNMKLEHTYGRFLENICINDEYPALVTMMLHIIFDKEELSDKNLMVLTGIYNDYKKSDFYDKENFFAKLAKEFTTKKTKNINDNIEKYKKTVLEQKVLKKSVIFNILDKLRIFITSNLRKIKMALLKRSFAIIGIDGSGKTTAVETLSHIYGSKSKIVYMGLKEFKIKKLDGIINSPIWEKTSDYKKIYYKVLLYVDLLYRYYSNRFRTRIIVYDRYIEDYFINSTGRMRIVDLLFYKIMFPKAKAYIYFHCLVETSLSRKDDILDEKVFAIRKNRYDKYFKKRKKVLDIDTDSLNRNQVIDKICEYINEKHISTTY